MQCDTVMTGLVLSKIPKTLKRKCCYFDEIFITGCIESCQNDNFQCSQWWKFRQNDIFVSVRSPVKVSYELSSVTLESYLYSASFIAILCMASLYIWPRYNGTWQDIVFTKHQCICKHHVAFRYQFGLIKVSQLSWWRYQMETFSALLAHCAGNSPVTGEFPAQKPVTRSFDVFVDLRSNTRLIE